MKYYLIEIHLRFQKEIEVNGKRGMYERHVWRGISL